MSARAPLTYREAVDALVERGRFGVRLGLGRTRALLRGLGNPERGIRGVLVGGTNGKGSVVALVAGCLSAAGWRTGETPKPHLVSYRERIRVGCRPIAADDFCDVVAEAIAVADRVAGRHGAPTEFELLTAVAFAHFARTGVDVGVVEVGLGGRLDATHAWDGGVAAITNVDLDHTEWLGTTVASIAREKAAIVMRGDLAITGATGEALQVIGRRAARVDAPLRAVSPCPVLAMGLDGIVVDLPGLGETKVGLIGRHQAANVAVADAVLDALGDAGIASCPPPARRAGYAAARWPGRLELVTVPGAAPGGAAAEVLLDGAHNPAGAAALAAAIDELRPLLRGGESRRRPPVTLVVASMADKDVDGVTRALAGARSLAGVRVIATAVAGDRALPAEALAARWRATLGGGSVAAVDDPREAVEQAVETAAGPVVVAGSLYLVGAARGLLVDDPDLRDPLDGEGTGG
ncbi:MAG: FolC bifunctional protein [Chloroflexi bacterium]|nr:FolC bifunctional protein [Chloroflexota bacterium]